MAANTAPIFPLSPIVGIATLTSATAITTRANITGTTGLTQLTATSTNGLRIDQITVSAKATTAAAGLDIWIYNGTTSTYFATIAMTAVTPSTTLAPFTGSLTFATLVLPPTYQLYISETVVQDVNVYALGGAY